LVDGDGIGLLGCIVDAEAIGILPVALRARRIVVVVRVTIEEQVTPSPLPDEYSIALVVVHVQELENVVAHDGRESRERATSRQDRGRGGAASGPWLMVMASAFLAAAMLGPIRCRSRLGGLLNFYYREAA
jgi:hypothetical protein